MKTARADRLRLAEDAALWLVRLQEDPSGRCREEFFEWARQSPRNMEEFLFAKAISVELGNIDPLGNIEIDRHALSALGNDAVLHLEEIAALQPAKDRRKSWKWAAGIAAVMLVAVGGFWAAQSTDDEQIYATATGDQQTIKLGDGSIMQLNTHSRVAVRFSNAAREVRLLEGEALFVVARDRARPFRVDAGAAVVEAIGTQFNVYRLPEATRISVVEGAVRVSQPAGRQAGASRPPVRLEAGAEAEVTGGRIIEKPRADIERAIAWRERSMVFHADPLERVIREFNRYNRQPIRLEDATVGRRRISGIFDADDPGPLLDFLASQPDFEVIHTDEAIVVRSRSSLP